MHPAVGNQGFVKSSLAELANRVTGASPDVQQYIGQVIGSNDPVQIETSRSALQTYLGNTLSTVNGEDSHQDIHYVSRFDVVGLYQSALAAIFADIPSLQGYGNANVTWISSIIDGIVNDMSAFFEKVYTDVHQNNQPLWQSLIKELINLPSLDGRAAFPSGVPAPIALPNDTEFTMALLADWGGDNPAAKAVANVVQKQNVNYAIHLGDIYYGGTQLECDTFLSLWPLKQNPADPNSPVLSGSSFALNGNHEMYSGGKFYFNTVLSAFGQPQSFFCLQNDHWRIIGLDTAYGNFRLMPTDDNDPLKAQWDWLTGLLSDGSGRGNILLTHHQPVSAYAAEWEAGETFRTEIETLLNLHPNMIDSVFGWFFGHEHRCAIYQDAVLPRYNARLIGNGCIPHDLPTTSAAEPGCTPVLAVNMRPDQAQSGAAISMYVKLTFGGSTLQVDYIDQDNEIWGTEVWDASQSRLNITKFQESDGLQPAG